MYKFLAGFVTGVASVLAFDAALRYKKDHEKREPNPGVCVCTGQKDEPQMDDEDCLCPTDDTMAESC